MKEIVRFALRPPALALQAGGMVVPEKVFRHLHRTGPFSVRLPAGRGTLRLMSWGNRVENEFFWRGWRGHEADTMPWWARLALTADTVLDIGANTGCFAYMAIGSNAWTVADGFSAFAM